jgi:hypothetical protein
MDVYEWVHVFECLLRLGKLDTLDLGSLLYRPPLTDEHRWSQLARQRMRLDYLRIRGEFLPSPSGRGVGGEGVDLGKEYRELLDAYDRGGLPFERVLTRLSYGRWLLTQKEAEQARAVNAVALELCRRFEMTLLEIDCLAFNADAGFPSGTGIIFSGTHAHETAKRGTMRK